MTMQSRHRNNAAEWVLWVVLLPVVPAVWAWNLIRSKSG